MELQEMFKSGTIPISKIVNLPKSDISWSRSVVGRFEKGHPLEFMPEEVQLTLYRPFTKKFGYRDSRVIDMQARRSVFPSSNDSISIATTNVAQGTFSAFATKGLVDLAFLMGDVFPSHVYVDSEVSSDNLIDFGDKRETSVKQGISDWALNLFQKKYADKSISKDQIFSYAYAALICPEFLKRYEQDARKSGPRLPLLRNFHEFSKIGKKLIDLHVNYDKIQVEQEYEIQFQKAPKDEKTLYSVKKMSIQKNERALTLRVNDHISINGIPSDCLNYKINGRSPLEWVVDQYQMSIDKDTTNLNDPNTFSTNPKYIFELALKSISLSLQTQSLFAQLPKFELLEHPNL